MMKYRKSNKKLGFSLIETLVASAIFVFIAVGIYSGFVNILKIINIIRTKEIMTDVASEQFEIARNLPYQEVGTVGGIPAGALSQNTEVVKDGKTFDVDFMVRNVDDPFDGTFDGTPKDLSPADMKLIEVTVSCSSCDSSLSSISFTTKVAPKNLETASTNGALVIKVFDALGLPVSGATVSIVNSITSPTIDLTDVTDINGVLTIVDAPPSVDGYQITVSKDGYSTDRTYAVGETANPNPIKPNITVVIQQISQISFTIDKVSEINFTVANNLCVATLGFNFDMRGDKLIGTDPSVYKYLQSLTTNSSGTLSLSDVEWDAYTMSITDTTDDIIGTNPFFPLSLNVNPDTEHNIKIFTAPKNGRRLLVAVLDSVTGLPAINVTVTLTNSGGYSSTIKTDQEFLNQTDWSGGSGQADFSDLTKYFDSDAGIDSTASGSVSLANTAGVYFTSGYLTSSTFDTGAASDFKEIIWEPATQPTETGSTSAQIQIATNNDNSTWDFVGPDGTSSTYYDSPNQVISSVHNGDRYLRYRLYLSTLDTLYTPTVSDISFRYTSSCIPPGQVSFPSLSLGTYTVSVSKSGYTNVSEDVEITGDWTRKEITISP